MVGCQYSDRLRNDGVRSVRAPRPPPAPSPEVLALRGSVEYCVELVVVVGVIACVDVFVNVTIGQPLRAVAIMALHAQLR